MNITIIRHGETDANVASIWAGIFNAKLTKRGKKQAEKVGKRMRKKDISAIYSSDLDRSRDTAMQVCKYHKHIELDQRKGLRERNFGNWEGLAVNETPKKKIGHESETQLIERAATQIQKIIRKHKQGDEIVIVAHGAFNKALLAFFLGMKRMPALFQSNTGVSQVAVSADGRYRVTLTNCTRHLSPKMTTPEVR